MPPRPPDYFWLKMVLMGTVIALVFLALITGLFFVTLSY